MANYQDTVLSLGYPKEVMHRYPEAEVPSDIPEALRNYYLQVGRMGFNRVHNKLYSPKDLEEKCDYIIFMSENQGVVQDTVNGLIILDNTAPTWVIG